MNRQRTVLDDRRHRAAGDIPGIEAAKSRGGSFMKRGLLLVAAIAIVALWAGVAAAGEWHAGTTNLCSDCHTMHFSMQHDWAGNAPVSTTPKPDGNWLSASGPNNFLLKAPVNQLCLSCHDGQTFAPDVLAVNANADPAEGRRAGALNNAGAGAPYETWKGHTLDSTATPPGFNPTAAGVPVTQQYNPAADGLVCISCHLQHGSATVYRNLGPRTAAFQPTYVLGTTNDATKDVWINIAAPYTPNSGNAATFNPLYSNANVSYNRTDPAAPAGSTLKSSNRLDTFCSSCHGDFHGGPGDANIGGTVAALDGFIRHPTAQTVIGASGTQGYGGHSALSRYTAATSKTKVYASDRAGYTDASPGCVSCHKAHGNQNPFGLVFLSRTATAVDEQGGFAAGQTGTQMEGFRNLCGQCHGQGN
jgi:doubled CXXCH motif protein